MLMPVRTAAPAKEVVSLAEVKAYLRVEHTDDDTTLRMLLASATQWLDGYSGVLGRALVDQTWRQDFCGFSACMRLPLRPVISNPVVKYYDGSNVQQTLDVGVYSLLSDARGPYVALAPDQSWPSTYSRPDAVSVNFVAGYGADATRVPAPLREAIFKRVANEFDGLDHDIDALISPYRCALL